MSDNKIYVGNLPYSMTESGLEELFSSSGKINNINVIQDRETGRSKGFAFVEFESSEGAEAALTLNGHQLEGRTIKVNIARERARTGGGGGGRRPGGGGGGNRSGGGGGRDRW